MKSVLAVLLLGATLGIAQTSADTLFQNAQAAGREGDYRKAEFWLRQMQTDFPRDDRWGLSLVGIIDAQGRFDDALKLARELQPRYAKNPTLFLEMGRLYSELGRPAEALTEYQTALPLSTSKDMTVSLRNMIGDSYRALGQLDQAIAEFRRAKALSGKASLILALALSTKGNREDEAEYQAVLKENPDQPAALNNLAYGWAERNVNLDAALTMSQRAVTVTRGSALMLDTLGWVQFKKGLQAEAEKTLVDALLMEGGNQDTLREHLAAVLDARAAWTPDRRTLRGLLDSGASPNELAQMKTLLTKTRLP